MDHRESLFSVTKMAGCPSSRTDHIPGVELNFIIIISGRVSVVVNTVAGFSTVVVVLHTISASCKILLCTAISSSKLRSTVSSRLR